MFWRLPFERGSDSWPPMPPEKHAQYPALKKRFEELDSVVVPDFTKHDLEALAAQRRYRRYQLILIVGAALTGFFGALQAALADSVWTGVVVTVLGLATTFVANQQRRARPLARYLTERAKAEELRSLYFRYLSGTVATDVQALEADVAAIGFPKKEQGTP